MGHLGHSGHQGLIKDGSYFFFIWGHWCLLVLFLEAFLSIQYHTISWVLDFFFLHFFDYYKILLFFFLLQKGGLFYFFPVYIIYFFLFLFFLPFSVTRMSIFFGEIRTGFLVRTYSLHNQNHAGFKQPKKAKVSDCRD